MRAPNRFGDFGKVTKTQLRDELKGDDYTHSGDIDALIKTAEFLHDEFDHIMHRSIVQHVHFERCGAVIFVAGSGFSQAYGGFFADASSGPKNGSTFTMSNVVDFHSTPTTNATPSSWEPAIMIRGESLDWDLGI